MIPEVKSALKISTARAEKNLTKEQKRFNLLIEKIEIKKQQLAELKIETTAFYELFAQEYQPELQKIKGLKIEFLLKLDRAGRSTQLSKREKKTLAELIHTLAYQILDIDSDAALKELCRYWCGVDLDQEYEAKQRQAADMPGSQRSATFSMDTPGDVDLTNPATGAEKIEAMRPDKLLHSEPAKPDAESQPSAKRIAKQARIAQQQKDLSLSIREVYRKLVSMLHPDRELDQQKRAEKNRLMQNVNIAYEARDLLQLLELQLQLEQIDQGHLDNLSETKLKHYVQVLADQERALADQISYLSAQFYRQFDLSEAKQISTLKRSLAADIKALKTISKRLKSDMELLRKLPDIKMYLSLLG